MVVIRPIECNRAICEAVGLPFENLIELQIKLTAADGPLVHAVYRLDDERSKTLCGAIGAMKSAEGGA